MNPLSTLVAVDFNSPIHIVTNEMKVTGTCLLVFTLIVLGVDLAGCHNPDEDPVDKPLMKNAPPPPPQPNKPHPNPSGA